jgi:hypothetical protein
MGWDVVKNSLLIQVENEINKKYLVFLDGNKIFSFFNRVYLLSTKVQKLIDNWIKSILYNNIDYKIDCEIFFCP